MKYFFIKAPMKTSHVSKNPDPLVFWRLDNLFLIEFWSTLMKEAGTIRY